MPTPNELSNESTKGTALNEPLTHCHTTKPLNGGESRVNNKGLPGNKPQGAVRHRVSKTLLSLLGTAAGPYQALQRFHRIILHRWWLWEIASLAVSALAMMAVVIILFKIDDTALADWAFPIQPNSLISVFMTVSKSALLVPIAECIGQSKWFEFRRGPRRLTKLQDFDEASRGPWGSAQLLFSPGAVGWIAWCGALLSVFSLALDPFTQQILAYPSRRVPLETGIAQVMMTQSIQRIDKTSMQGAILSSIYAPKESYITYNCTTSSCSWNQPVTSLSICAACRNIRSLVTPECTTSPGPLVPTDGEKWSFSTTTCTYIINPKVSFSIYIQTLSFPAANGRHAEYASQYTQLKVMTISTRFGLGSLLNDNISWVSTIVAYVTDFDKEQREMPPLRIQDLKPDILVCGIYFCAQAFQGLAVTNGSLVNTTPAISRPLYSALGSDGKPAMVLVDGGWSEVLALNRTGPEAVTNPFPGNTTFLISQRAKFSLLGCFRDTFYGIFNLTQSSGNDVFSVFPEHNSGMDGLLKTAYKNMSDAFTQLAGGITGQLRIADGSQPAFGNALADETFVRVRWPWMTLPLALLFCALALLARTILRDNKAATRIWKSSSIALLVHALQGCDQQSAPLSGLEKMDEFARSVTVRLEACGSGGLGYTFVRVPEEPARN